MDSKADTIFSESSVLLCVDLQSCYYQPPVTDLFPKLEEKVQKVLSFCRDSRVQVVHVRQEDVREVSEWLDWWEELHPDKVDDLGVPTPLDCAKEGENEPVFIKNTFDGFYRTGLDQYLRERKVRTLIVMGLITRACVLNTVMSAFNSGYRVILLGDCCGDRSLEVHRQILSTYNGYNCRVIDSAELLNLKVI